MDTLPFKKIYTEINFLPFKSIVWHIEQWILLQKQKNNVHIAIVVYAFWRLPKSILRYLEKILT